MALFGIELYGTSNAVNPNGFFSELKRRNVYKVAVAYAVVAWLLIQAASILFPAFDAPASAMKILVIVLVVGFPITLAFLLRDDPSFEKIVATLAPKEPPK